MKTVFEKCLEEICFAYENVSFFRRHMDAAGLSPEDIATPEDLRRIPPTSKSHYRVNFPAGVLAKGKTLKEPLSYRAQSSGTEDERLVTMCHLSTLTRRMASCVSANPPLERFLMGTRRLRSCSYAAPNCSDVDCANPASGMKDRLLPDGTLILPVHHDLLTTSDRMIDQAIAEIEEYKPQYYYVDPTHLAFLVRGMAKRGLPPPECQAISLSYNFVTHASRRQIAAFFQGVPLSNVVGMSELGWLGISCPEGRIHLNDQAYYLELLVDGRPAEQGEVADLYVTSLGDRLSPHIRYHTRDLYSLAGGTCPCGHPSPPVHFEGRARDALSAGGRILLTPRQLDELIGPAEWLDVYQMRQITEAHYVFRYVARPGADAPRAALLDALRSALGAGAEIDVEDTRYIPAERSGKLLSCVVDLRQGKA